MTQLTSGNTGVQTKIFLTQVPNAFTTLLNSFLRRQREAVPPKHCPERGAGLTRNSSGLGGSTIPLRKISKVFRPPPPLSLIPHSTKHLLLCSGSHVACLQGGHTAWPAGTHTWGHVVPQLDVNY